MIFDTMVTPLSNGDEYGWFMEGLEILSQPYEGYTPDESARIIDMWNKYSDKIYDVSRSVMREVNTVHK